MGWYTAKLLWDTGRKTGLNSIVELSQVLLEATEPLIAYDLAVKAGRAGTRESLGVVDLIEVYEAPSDGSELWWTPMEIAPSDLGMLIKPLDLLATSGGRGAPHQSTVSGISKSGWYAADTVLREVHDVGTHGPLDLVWVNRILLRSTTDLCAAEKAMDLGAGSAKLAHHWCDGERAHWQFAGLANLLPLDEPPANGAVLWREQKEVAQAELRTLVPAAADLTVFRHLRELAIKRRQSQ